MGIQASKLIDSLEFVAKEEMALISKTTETPSTVLIPRFKFYVPVVITTAELKIYKFDPKNVDIKDGCLHDGTYEIESVPWIRFSKCLGSYKSKLGHSKNLAEVNKEDRRTVYIVNGEHMIDFISKFQLDRPPEYFGPPPWDVVLKRYIDDRNLK